MNTFPLISVILPVYNAEKYVFEAVNSVLKQTYENFELIIIDDGSTDNSLKIINEFDDERIKIIKNKQNLGLIKTLNIGLEHCSGDFIARFDADDICLPERFKKQVYFLINHPEIDILGSAFKIFGNKNETVNVITNPEEIELELFINNIVCHPSIMMRKKSIENIKYNSAFLHNEDWAFWLECLKNGLKISNINEVLLKYRIEGQNISIKHQDTSVNRTKILFNQYLKDFFDKEKTTVDLHLLISKGFFDIKTINIDAIKTHFNKLEDYFIQKGYNKNLVKKTLDHKKNKLFYLIADKNKKTAIKYLIKLNIFKLKHLRYLI